MIQNTNMMKNTIKKIGDVWCSPKTLENNFPKSCVVNCKVFEMKIPDDLPVLFRKKSSAHYEVFGKNRKDYEEILAQIKGVSK